MKEAPPLIFHKRLIFRSAICEWMPEFSTKKQAYGPITKPQPQVTSTCPISNHKYHAINSFPNPVPVVMPIIPIIPSINTCMSLTINTPTTTNTTTTPMTPKMPELNTNELQALAEVCSNVVPNTTLTSPLAANNTMTTMVTQATAMTMSADIAGSSLATPMPNVVMNSLMNSSKIVTDEAVQNPMLASVPMPESLPVACLPPPVAVMREHGEVGEIEEKPVSLGNVIEMEDVEVERAVEAIDVELGEGKLELDDANGSGGEEEETMAVVEEIEAAGATEEPMEECATTGSFSSPKHPSSTKSEDVMMAENGSVSWIVLSLYG